MWSFPFSHAPTGWPSNLKEFPTHCGDVALGLPHPSHFRGVQDMGSSALYLFPEAVRIKNLMGEKPQMSIGHMLSSFWNLKKPFGQMEMEGAGAGSWVDWKDPASSVTNGGTDYQEDGGQGSSPGRKDLPCLWKWHIHVQRRRGTGTFWKEKEESGLLNLLGTIALAGAGRMVLGVNVILIFERTILSNKWSFFFVVCVLIL